jgi:hypothetical protein
MPLYIFRNDERLPCRYCGAVLDYWTVGHDGVGADDGEHLPVACAEHLGFGTPEPAPSGLRVMFMTTPREAAARGFAMDPGRVP